MLSYHYGHIWLLFELDIPGRVNYKLSFYGQGRAVDPANGEIFYFPLQRMQTRYMPLKRAACAVPDVGHRSFLDPVCTSCGAKGASYNFLALTLA